MSKNLITIIALIFSNFVFSQENSVTIIGFGDGKTRNEATNAALRQCIEKTFGVFVTTNSQLENDQLVKDEIATIASGNIISYDVISELQKDDKYSVTVSAIVSPSSIIKTFKTKGYSFEINGEVYYQNILKEEFYKNEEPIILKNFFDQWKNVQFFDYTVKERNLQRVVFYTDCEGGCTSMMEKIQDSIFRFVKGHMYANHFSKKQSDFFELSDYLETMNLSTRYSDYDLLHSSLRKIPQIPEKEVWQVPYIIYLKPNSNFFSFTKSLRELLFSIQIKNKNDYSKLYGNIYTYGAFFTSKDFNQFSLRNQESLSTINKTYSYTLKYQLECRNIRLTNVEDLLYPIVFSEVEYDYYRGIIPISRLENSFTENVFEDVIEKRYYIITPVAIMINLTKSELANFKAKIKFDFDKFPELSDD